MRKHFRYGIRSLLTGSGAFRVKRLQIVLFAHEPQKRGKAMRRNIFRAHRPGYSGRDTVFGNNVQR